ncbi:MAG TPA: PadR family transcriptional regulator [Gemmatimonadales bacterium]|jgi:DNA-binding PadR family transcriptional regulator|nr:PadR family transcriptional regulator [Gemmatimonadales bacterium]
MAEAPSVITPLTYEILLALASQDCHGYGIIKEIEERAGEASAPSTGALYLALQRMESDGLIEEAPGRPTSGDDARRRYYRLTRRGREAAKAESARLAALVAAARRKRLLPASADA